MADRTGILWVSGENKNGCLGFADGKHRIIPQQHPFFMDKRLVDFSCGTGFSVVIVETFDLDKTEKD